MNSVWTESSSFKKGEVLSKDIETDIFYYRCWNGGIINRIYVK